MDFEEALSVYLAQTSRPASIRTAIAQWWKKFAAFCFPRCLDIKDLAPRHLEDFEQFLQWEPNASGRLYSSNTKDQILRCIRDVLRWLFQDGYFSEDPSRELMLPRPIQPQARILAWDEVVSVLQAPDCSKGNGLRDALILRVLVEADLEVHLCLALQVGDAHTLALEKATRDLLDAYLAEVRPQWLRQETPSKFLFLNPYGSRLGKQTVTNALRQAAKLAGVAGTVSVKCLRRSYRAGLEKQTQSRLVIVGQES